MKLRLNSVLFFLSVSEMVGRKRKTTYLAYQVIIYLYSVYNNICIYTLIHT